ncbi:TetR/AcrR family transcriptional regulator [Halomonas daqingensis]|uniref:TetR/AcrR family transcriptional regulator n=1 Tax=Billgrantia desiderata TaxID=52021 RepID=A0ABS9B232_9GAMM|nr:TetR/AcrR family transcriptional regulator [Halomonas desiderata]MCE8041535.1 TetR/AcrR family transcriptional regulator [Halomonas desiderata]MCE8046110.1 TetR/AcrR family transcriptional regulator [Halomonas desiderata]
MTRGRPLTFNPDQAVQSAMHVFWSRGYDSASTRDLLAAMGLSRSSLYQAFGNKELLFVDALRRYRESLLDRLRQRLAREPTAYAFFESLFQTTAQDVGSERAALGCLIFNSATELGQREDLAAAEARCSVAAITELFQSAVEQGQAEGSIATQRDPAALATYLTMGMAGLRTLLKSGADRDRIDAATTLILHSLR